MWSLVIQQKHIEHLLKGQCDFRDELVLLKQKGFWLKESYFQHWRLLTNHYVNKQIR